MGWWKNRWKPRGLIIVASRTTTSRVVVAFVVVVVVVLCLRNYVLLHSNSLLAAITTVSHHQDYPVPGKVIVEGTYISITDPSNDESSSVVSQEAWERWANRWNDIKENTNNKISNNNNNMKKKHNYTNHSLVGFHVFDPTKVKDRIIVLGERHSGTTYFTKLLQTCFPHLSSVGDVFVNGKHWMQPTPEDVRRVVQAATSGEYHGMQDLELSSWWSLVSKSENGSIENVFQSSLVLALFRDPYQWVEAMRRKPHHWPNHVSFQPIQKSQVSTTNESVLMVAQAVYNNAPSKELQSMDGLNMNKSQFNNNNNNSNIRIPPESTTFGAKIVGGSIQKSFVRHEILPWTDFVQQKLYLEQDRIQQQEPPNNIKLGICQKGYRHNNISPCKRNITYVPREIQHIPPAFLRHLFASANDPVYELDIHGKPYENLLQLRAAKIQNMLQIPALWKVGAFAVIPYETLQSDPESLVKQVQQLLTNQNRQCLFTKPYEKKPYILPDAFREWITHYTDWKTEELIGYNPQ